ncbi:MAG: S4 domain-containing protein [Candidatus Hydrothermia bacterium]|nr:S4 domain-containing protein [Candidatus Hydrothermia bacterium]
MLFKFLQKTGYFSRRSAIRAIKYGLIKVNGKIIREPWFDVSEKDRITLKGFEIKMNMPIDYIIYYKPPNSTYFPKEIKHLIPLENLPKSDEGLIILTNDGEVHRAYHKKFVKNKYLVELSAPISENFNNQNVKISQISRNKAIITTIKIKVNQLKKIIPTIKKLKRIETEPIVLPMDLKPGRYRKMTEEEIIALKRIF